VTHINVSVIGASGYGGAETVRLLATHPCVRIIHVTAETNKGAAMSTLYPNLRGFVDQTMIDADPVRIGSESDVTFLSLPSGKAMHLVPDLLQQGCKVIDIAADFRLKDAALYPIWYKVTHTATAYLPEAVYGLPELHRAAIRHAFSETNENVRAYSVVGHNHTPEIEQELTGVAGTAVRIVFTPHLIPMTRGILVTAYAPLTTDLSAAEAMDLYHEAYDSEPFVRVLEDALPETKASLGSNFCDVAVRIDQRAGVAIALAAIDNLGRGAAGQAVQNMNLMCGLPEETGLNFPGVYP
jgi:N-acetyl-gamma-glutamyl-phosphate reductase